MVISLSVIALTFAFFDILAQVPQGLYYNLDRVKFETSVDLVDFMLLIQMKIDASQYLLKGVLLAAAVLYLFGFVWFYQRSRRSINLTEASLLPVQEGQQSSSNMG